MEIKDLSVFVERLEDVRGGLTSVVDQIGIQAGLNSASSSAFSGGVGNTTVSSTRQVAPQVFSQDAGVSAVEIDRDFTSIADSLVFGNFGW